MEQNTTPNNYASDNIDLRELVQTLWAGKLWIIITTLVITGAAAIYVTVTPPVYETELQTLPPTTSGLTAYNMGGQLTGGVIADITKEDKPTQESVGIPKLNVEVAYRAFLQHLTSNTIRQKFFDEVYLPEHGNDKNASNQQKLWGRLNKDLRVTLPKTPSDKTATLSFDGTNPSSIAKWANTYANMAMTATAKELLGDLAGDVNLRKESINSQISALRKVALITRKDHIARLENALTTAEAIGLEVPPQGSPLITVNGASFNDGGMMYLRGAKALRSELGLLRQRKNDDPYIPELGNLLKKQVLLDAIDLNPENLTVAIIDRAAVAPQYPIKPRKASILALGCFLGVMLGVFIVIVRRTTKQRS